MEEHEVRFTNLEQRDKEKTTLIAKLDDDIRGIKQSLVNTSSIENNPEQVKKITKPSNTSSNTSNSDVCQPMEDKETDDFLGEAYKKSISDGIR